MRTDRRCNRVGSGRPRGSGLFALSLAALLAPAATAFANPTLRLQVDQRGDFTMIGNTLAQECDTAIGTPAVPPPVVGTIGMCPEINFTAPDVYWRSDDPGDGQALADSSIAPADARSTAVLNLPSGANVTYARLYWGSYASSMSPDPHVRMERTSSGLNSMLMADQVLTLMETGVAGRYWYQASVDVTSTVHDQGPGPFRVGEVSSVALDSLVDPYAFVAWYMVVFYELPGQPQRNLALFDGLDLVQPGGPASVTLSGFLVPPSGYDAKLGIVAFEGDATITGDGISFGNTLLSDPQNPADNFFNSTRTTLGMPVSVAGDLPQNTGTPRSMSGLDLDVEDLTSLVTPGQTSATLNATSTLDTYLLTTFVTSISTLKPTFTTSKKSLTDVNGGAIRPGDELDYTIDVTNTGSDDSIQTVVSDVVPTGTTFEPGSIEIVAGSGMGKLTDAAGDDAGEYDDATRTVTVRVGTGQTGSAGGSVAMNETTSVRFRVKINTDTRGIISNQGAIRAAGKRGSAPETTNTDGDSGKPGTQTTDVNVNVCDMDSDCMPPTPLCDISSDPQSCVACVTSLDCNDPAAPDCSTQTHTCGCWASTGKCETDSDGDGISDDGERMIGTDPNDWDTDDDGTPDGGEFAPEIDSDGDGLDNAHDADSDNDGIFDGTEQGYDCSNPATKLSSGRCRPDADRGKTKTNPVKADTDRGGVSDGSEDFNLNGAVDTGETDPSSGNGTDDKVVDADGDGLSDGLEMFLHSDPGDGDSDDDGVPDGKEANPSEDTDLDRLINVLDVDSDDDALYDGTESGLDCSAKGTLISANHCIADADSGATKTSPLLYDTDGAGARDGSEDPNGNGRLDANETDPTKGHGADDSKVVDTDGDGLSDPLETAAGSNPNDKDSDDDGLLDGDEHNPRDDRDGDGMIDLLDPDSDGDGLFDGTEAGKSCTDPSTDMSKMTCAPDADNTTNTGVLSADTDRGGVKDGIEDVNHNGRIDPAELDPNDPSDDVIGKPCMVDADCGKTDSGLICDNGMCGFGCRGMGGNTCPSPLYCSSLTNMAGMCGPNPPEMPVVDAGHPPPPAPDAGMLAPGGKLGGGGCNCRVGLQPSAASDSRAALAGLALVLLGWRLRRRARRA
jgi:clumping factor A